MVTRKQLSKMSHEAVAKLHSLITETLNVQVSRSQKFRAIRDEIETSIKNDGLAITDIDDLFVKRRRRLPSKKAAKYASRSEAMKAAWQRRKATSDKKALLTRSIEKKATPKKVSSKRTAKKSLTKKKTPTQRSEAMKAAWARRKALLAAEAS